MTLTRKREENAGEKAFKKTAFSGLTQTAGLRIIKVCEDYLQSFLRFFPSPSFPSSFLHIHVFRLA